MGTAKVTKVLEGYNIVTASGSHYMARWVQNPAPHFKGWWLAVTECLPDFSVSLRSQSTPSYCLTVGEVKEHISISMDWDVSPEPPTCSLCDAIGHGYPGGGPCPLEERGAWDADEDLRRFGAY